MFSHNHVCHVLYFKTVFPSMSILAALVPNFLSIQECHLIFEFAM